MTTSDFKKIARVLKLVYSQLENEAMAAGIDPTSDEFEIVKNAAREAVLQKHGFTVEEYSAAKEELAKEKIAEKQRVYEVLGEISNKIESLSKARIPTTEEIRSEAHEIAKQYIKEPQIINQIVKETVVEKPIVIENTVYNEVEKDAKPYDDSPLRARIDEIENKVYNIKIPEHPVQPLQESINIHNMPDFRKLAMGIQGDVDALRSQINNISTTPSTINTEVPTGDIDDSNTSFVVTNEPLFIVVNGATYKEGEGLYSSYSGGTITLSSPVGGGGFIRSYY